MQIIFWSFFYPPEKEHYYLSKTNHLQNQVNSFNLAVIGGLSSQNTTVFSHIINSYPFGTFPTYRQIFFHESRDSLSFGNDITTIGLINLPIAKQITRKHNIIKRTEEILRGGGASEKTVLLIYSLYEPYMSAALKIKKRFPNVIVVPIITDLPGKFGLEDYRGIKGLLSSFFGRRAIKEARQCDKYILLTEQMSEIVNPNERPFLVIEGIYSPQKQTAKEKADSGNRIKRLFYGGVLRKEYGIERLVMAFCKLDNPQVELDICGYGNSSQMVRDASRKDPRIHFFGFLPKEQTLELEAQADFLINPRPNEGFFVKYSFPSKTLEYLSTGIPVLMYQLDGIPHEYDQYINYLRGNNPYDLSKDLLFYLQTDYASLKEKAHLGQSFVRNTKNQAYQTAKIINFLKS